MSDFTTAKKALNDQQLSAVEAIEGPVMVLAGPGTGKTQTVALRIAEILARTQVGPKNILALTFTEAGVTALRSRLETIIGVDAYQVTISTFHSFGSEIISSFPYVFNFDENATRLSELDRFLLLEQIVSKLPDLELLRPVKMPTAHIRAIAEAIRTCKQEAVSPASLADLAAAEISEVEALPKLSKIEREKRLNTAKKNSELARIYAAYQAELTKRHRYDYEDMILLVVAALQDNEELRLFYQEKYQYILVDEYQDTNSSQNALVETLASFFTNPNLFVVGDDKQAIYRFQGASVANMLHFAKKYPDMEVVTLTNNYRSSPEIVAAATELITHNSQQLGAFLPQANQQLTAVSPAGSKPALVTLPTSLAQFEWIVSRITELTESGAATNSVAVLFRTNNEVRDFRALAEKNGLLVSGAVTADLITEPEIQLLITMLRAINQPKNNLAVMPSLRALNGGPTLLALLELYGGKERGSSLISLALDSNNPELAKSAQTILDLHQLAGKASLLELLEQIIATTTLLEQVRRRPDQLEGLELIAAFMREAKQFSARQPSAQLSDFLEYIDLLGRYNIRIPVNRALPELGGVFVSTVHGAKGLEFDTVFMANVDENSWKTRANRSLIKLPSAIVDLKNWAADAQQDDRRLFYVGVTRAKQALYLTYASHNDSGQEQLPCQFALEMQTELQSLSVTVQPAELIAEYERSVQPIGRAVVSKRELMYIREKIAATPLSFTSYQAYKTCPKQFLLRYVFGLPTEATIPLVYGTAIHKALEQFFRSYKARKTLPSVDELLEHFRVALTSQPPVEGLANLLAKGQEVLSGYYAANASKWKIPEGVEYSFNKHQVMLGTVPITGKFDRLDVLDTKTKAVRVIDYKTVTTVPSRNDILGLTKTSDGHLKLQLTFYSLLAETDRLFPYRAKEFVLSFIDNKGTFKEESFIITKEDRAALAAEITAAHTELLTLEHFSHTRETFDHGCEICAAFPNL